MTILLKKKQSRKPWKSIQPTVINGSTMKTRILVLKHQLTVKYLTVWPREQLLVKKKKQRQQQKQTNKQILIWAPGKGPRKAILPHRNLPPFGPSLPSEFPLPSVVRVRIFSGTKRFMYYSCGKHRWWKVESWLDGNWRIKMGFTRLKLRVLISLPRQLAMSEITMMTFH